MPVVAAPAPSPPPSAAPASAGGRLSDAEVDAALALSGAMAPERADTYGGGYGGYGGGSASASAKLTPGYDEPSYGYGGYEGSGSKRGYSNYGSGALTPPSAPAAPPPPADGWNAFDDEGYMATVSKQAAKDVAVGMGEMNDEELEHAVNCFAHFDVGRTGLLKIPQFTELLRVVHKAEGEAVVGAEQAKAIFQQADLSDDGAVDFNEFLRFHGVYISVPFAGLLAEARRAG